MFNVRLGRSEGFLLTMMNVSARIRSHSRLSYLHLACNLLIPAILAYATGVQASASVDVQRPWGAIGEAALVIGPLAALQRRLQELLAEWPDNPLLMQLLAVCSRIQGRIHGRSRCS